jgi:hypothetical protein
VGAFDGPVAQRQRAADERLGAQAIKKGRRQADVHEAVDGADLVEADLGWLQPVDLALGIGQKGKGAHGQVPGLVRHDGRLKEGRDVSKGPVRMLWLEIGDEGVAGDAADGPLAQPDKACQIAQAKIGQECVKAWLIQP